MKMDGDYLGGEQRLALEQKLTPYISENREIQIQIAKAVKRFKKIDSINKSALTNLLTIGLREAIILTIASTVSAGATIAIGASASVIRYSSWYKTTNLLP